MLDLSHLRAAHKRLEPHVGPLVNADVFDIWAALPALLAVAEAANALRSVDEELWRLSTKASASLIYEQALDSALAELKAGKNQ